MIRTNAGEGKPPPLWDFESLFPEPMWDDDTIYRDLFEINANKIVATGSDKIGSSTKETADKIRKIIYSSREMNPDLIANTNIRRSNELYSTTCDGVMIAVIVMMMIVNAKAIHQQ